MYNFHMIRISVVAIAVQALTPTRAHFNNLSKVTNICSSLVCLFSSFPTNVPPILCSPYFVKNVVGQLVFFHRNVLAALTSCSGTLVVVVVVTLFLCRQ